MPFSLSVKKIKFDGFKNFWRHRLPEKSQKFVLAGCQIFQLSFLLGRNFLVFFFAPKCRRRNRNSSSNSVSRGSTETKKAFRSKLLKAVWKIFEFIFIVIKSYLMQKWQKTLRCATTGEFSFNFPSIGQLLISLEFLRHYVFSKFLRMTFLRFS